MEVLFFHWLVLVWIWENMTPNDTEVPQSLAWHTVPYLPRHIWGSVNLWFQPITSPGICLAPYEVLRGFVV